jgi:hypothetical protein
MDLKQLIVWLLDMGLAAFGVWVQDQLNAAWPWFAAQGMLVKRSAAYGTVILATCGLWWLGVWFDVFAPPETFKAFALAVSPYIILGLTINQGVHAEARDTGKIK